MMEKEKRENCAGIHEKGYFLFVCVLKNGRKEASRFSFDHVGMKALVKWLMEKGCVAAVTSIRQEGWKLLQSAFLQSHIPLYVYFGKKLPVKAGKPMAEALAQHLSEGDPQIGLPEENESDEMEAANAVATRNSMVDYVSDVLGQVEKLYREAGIDYVSLLGGANEVQTIQILLIFCRPLRWQLHIKDLKEMQENGKLPPLMNLEWLLGMYGQRQSAPPAEMVLYLLSTYVKRRMFIDMMDVEILPAVGEEKVKKFLKPIPHLGYGELMSVEQLTEEMVKGCRAKK